MTISTQASELGKLKCDILTEHKRKQSKISQQRRKTASSNLYCANRFPSSTINVTAHTFTARIVQKGTIRKSRAQARCSRIKRVVCTVGRGVAIILKVRQVLVIIQSLTEVIFVKKGSVQAQLN